MLYTTEYTHSLPRHSFEAMMNAVISFHTLAGMQYDGAGKHIFLDSPKAVSWFIRFHQDGANLKHSYSLLSSNNYSYMPLGIYAYLAAKSLVVEDDKVVDRLLNYFHNHFAMATTFGKKQSAHMFAHLYHYLSNKDPVVLDLLMPKILHYQMNIESKQDAKQQKLAWQRNLGLLCPSYAHGELKDSGIVEGVVNHLGGEDGLINWFKENLPGRLRMDFIKAYGHEDILMKWLENSTKRKMLSEDLGL